MHYSWSRWTLKGWIISESQIVITEENYPEYELTKYGEILESHNLEWSSRSMEDADVSNMDIQGVLALLMGMVRGERFCDGTILSMLKNGTVIKWLERIKDIVEL